MIYIIAIYLTQIVLVYRVEDNIGDSLEPFFGSVPVRGLSDAPFDKDWLKRNAKEKKEKKEKWEAKIGEKLKGC